MSSEPIATQLRKRVSITLSMNMNLFSAFPCVLHPTETMAD